MTTDEMVQMAKWIAKGYHRRCALATYEDANREAQWTSFDDMVQEALAAMLRAHKTYLEHPEGDERGYLYMVDRLKDMIKSGGMNIYSREVEEVLEAHPEVEEAAVIGVPHEKWGESIRAIIIRKKGSRLTQDGLLAHCRERLAGFKKPSSVVFVDSMPKGTFGGKVLKRALREQYGEP